MDALYKQLRFLIENGGEETVKYMVSHRITKMRCASCGEVHTENFKQKTCWPNDKKNKEYGENQKIKNIMDRPETYDLTNNQV